MILTDEEKLTALLDSLDLLTILKQNDVEHLTVLEILHADGWLDIDYYFCEDIPRYLQEEEE